MAGEYVKRSNLIGFGGHATIDLRVTLLVILGWALAVLLVKLVQDFRLRREKWTYFKRGNVPQVPFYSLLFGNLQELIGRSNNIMLMDEYHKKLGKTFGAFYGPYPWAFTCDADLIQKIFVTEGNKFIDTQLFKLPFVSELNKSIAQLREKDWRPLRKALNPSFNNKQMKSDNVFLDLEATIGKLINCIENHPKETSASTDEEAFVIDVLYNFRKFTVDLIFRVAYDNNEIIDWTPMKNDVTIDKLVSAAYKVRNLLTYLSIVFDGTQRFFGFLTQFTALGRDIAYFQKIIGETIVRRRKLAPEKIQLSRKMIDSLMEGVQRTGLDEETLRANMFFLFVAGFDTTANSLSATVWLLAKHKDKQDKLRAALMAEGDSCEYLTWCLKESLRLYPPAPTGIGRDVPEDFEFKGMKFFKGSAIVANIYSLHRDKDYWGDDVEVFRPERFSDSSNHHPAQYMAFALGPRNCIGYNFAMLEMRTVIARLVVNYRIEVHSTTPDKITFSAQNLLTLSVHGPIKIRLIKISGE